jgi:hypothetical protein
MTQEASVLTNELRTLVAKAKPNPTINGHQEWLDGLVSAAPETAKQ